MANLGDVLFSPFRLKHLELKNRIVMPAMSRFFCQDSVPGDDVLRYYRRRADNDVGLIISEAVLVERPRAGKSPREPRFHGQEPLNGWRRVIDSVHAGGGKIGPQLWHVGTVAGSHPGSPPPSEMEGPSGLSAPGRLTGRTMTDADIADTIDAYAKGAAEAKRLNADLVEVHGAHGYLFDQFFWSPLNKRQDRFGGATLRERATFAVETVRAMRAAVGPDFPIFFRISQFKQQDYDARVAHSPAELAEWLEPLIDAGVDVLHCSQRRFWQAEFPDVDGEKGLNLAGWAKKLTGAITISVGSVGLSGEIMAAMYGGESSQPVGIEELVRRIDNKEFDLIAVGRAIANDPEWVSKIKRGDWSAIRGFDPASLAGLV